MSGTKLRMFLLFFFFQRYRVHSPSGTGYKIPEVHYSLKDGLDSDGKQTYLRMSVYTRSTPFLLVYRFIERKSYAPQKSSFSPF